VQIRKAAALSHLNGLILLDAVNPSAPANKQTECQKASRLRGGGAAKVSISPSLLNSLRSRTALLIASINVGLLLGLVRMLPLLWYVSVPNIAWNNITDRFM